MEGDKCPNATEICKLAVDELFEFRNKYFINNSVDKADQKAGEIQERMMETIAKIDSVKDEIKDRSMYFMLRGKALNVSTEYNNESYEHLAKAVKLDPKLVDAWNELGECYWKKGEIKSAMNCFTGAVNQSKNKVSLRNLSMVLRQLSTSDTESKLKNIQESVEKAREAVNLDPKDGISWYVLGNAFLALFFAAGQGPQFLKQSMSAYIQADNDPLAKYTADLHYNRAVAYRYEEMFEKSLEGFHRAYTLDPSWEEAASKLKDLHNYLTSISQLVQSKGKMKPKKLHQIKSAFKPSDLGVYGGGSYTGHTGSKLALEPVAFAQLVDGSNPNKVVVGKVVCSITHSEPVPFTFCLVDKELKCLAVTVYNIAPGYGFIIGDSVAIAEPLLLSQKFTFNQGEYEFQSIRVCTPMLLVVNGRKLGVDKQAPSVLSVQSVND